MVREAFELMQDKDYSSAVVKLNDNFGTLGYFIVGLFALSWIVSIFFYKWRRFDDLDLKTEEEFVAS